MAMQDNEATEAPEAPGAEAMEGEDDGSYCIEIKVNSDGTFTVGVESASYEAAEEAGAEAAGEAKEPGQTYDSIKEALTAVLDIVRGNGAATPSAPISKTNEQQAMMAGFREGRV